MVPTLPLLSCESSVSVKENPDRKKKNATVSSLVESPQSSAALVITGAIFKKFPHVSFAHLDTLIH